MYIARLSLICLVAFAFLIGCGMLNKQAEMTEPTQTETAEAVTVTEVVKTKPVIEEVTLKVTGMT